MSPASGPFAIAATLLVLGGALEAARPSDTATALRGVGLRISPNVVRLGGVAEAAVGLYAFLVADRISAGLVAVSYLAFASFVGLALAKKAPIATCGCFGKPDTPPSLLHVAVNLGAVVCAIAITLDPRAGIVESLSTQPLAGVPYLLLIAGGTFLAFLALTALPRTMALVRRSEVP